MLSKYLLILFDTFRGLFLSCYVIFVQVLQSSLTTGCPASCWKKRKEKSQSFWSTVPLYEPFTLKWYLLLLLAILTPLEHSLNFYFELTLHLFHSADTFVQRLIISSFKCKKNND